MSPDIYSSALPLVVLSEKDIPGADLDEPLQNHTMPACITMVAPNSKPF